MGEPFPLERHFAAAVVQECLVGDMWIYPAGSGPVRDAVMIGCPFTISEDEIELVVQTLRAAVDGAAGLTPRR